jgi:hypothetical protein
LNAFVGPVSDTTNTMGCMAAAGSGQQRGWRGQDHLHPGAPPYHASAPLLRPGSKGREHPRRPSHGEGGSAPGRAVRPLQHPPGGPPHYRCARRGRAAIPLDLVSPWPPPYPSLPPSSSIFISGSRFSLYGEPSTGGGPWRPLRATTRLVLLVAVLCHGRRSDRIMGSQGARGQRRACYQGRGGQVTIGECLETSSTHKIVTRRSHEGLTCHNINQNSIARLNYREQSHKAKERHLRTGNR